MKEDVNKIQYLVMLTLDAGSVPDSGGPGQRVLGHSIDLYCAATYHKSLYRICFISGGFCKMFH